MAFNVAIKDWGGWKIAEISGDFTTRSIIEVRKLFQELEDTRSSRIAIDLSQSEFIDTQAIQLLVNYSKRLLTAGGKFKIIEPSNDALDILRMLCVNDLIALCSSRESFERSC